MTDSRESELLASVPTGLLINGEWRSAEAGKTVAVNDPATGDVLLEIADASIDDGVAAMDAAADAFPSWAATPSRERAEILRRAFDLLQERKEDIALLMTLEMGKPLAEARGEVGYGGEFLRWFSEVTAHTQGRYGANPEGTGRMIVSQHPVGPCYLITPWNFPLAMATRKIAPALAAGCTVVIKPATLTPLTTLFFAQILQDAGLPAGVVNVVTTTNTGPVSERIISDLFDRARSGAMTVSVDIAALVDELIARIDLPPGIRLARQIPAGLPAAVLDRDRVGQILWNLMTNATQAMRAGGGGVLTIAATIADDRLRFEISDSGPGIPAEDADRIFEPLYTTKSEGVGLGLSISRAFARATGGDLRLERTGPAGTTFVLELPAR